MCAEGAGGTSCSAAPAVDSCISWGSVVDCCAGAPAEMVEARGRIAWVWMFIWAAADCVPA